MKRLDRWLFLAALALCIPGLLIFSHRRETASMEELRRYANGPLLRFSVNYAQQGAAVSIVRAANVPDDAVVRYTLDGADPRSGGTVYTGPVSVPAGDWTHMPVLRAVLRYADEDSEIYTQAVPATAQFSLPEPMCLVSIVTDPKNLYDYETGIMVEGKVMDDAKRNSPESFQNLESWQIPANFKMRGDDWIRSADVQVFGQNGQPAGEQSVGLSISGNASAYYDVKSLKLTAKWQNPDGQDFPANWFGFSRQSETDVSQPDSFNKISLKNGGQDRNKSFLRTAALYPLASASGLTTVETLPALVYLNGEFYSYMYVQPHLNRDYLGNLFGLDKESIEWFEASERAFLPHTGLSELLEQDPNDPAAARQLEQLVDVENLLLYYAFELTVNNRDSVLNNFGAWRYTGPAEPGNPLTDGRYRFVLFDIDTAIEAKADCFDDVLNENGVLYSPLLNWVLKIPGYRESFVNTVLNLVNTTLSPQSLADAIQREAANQQRWMQDGLFGDVIRQSFSEELSTYTSAALRRAVARREAAYIKLSSRLAVSPERYTLSLRTDAPNCCVRLENLTVGYADNYAGQYLADCPVTLRAEVGSGRVFRHWLVNGIPLSGDTLRIDSRLLDGQDALQVELVTEPTPEPTLVVNEVSAKGDMDWIELKNTGQTEIDLSRLYISNRADRPEQCRLPKVALKPGELLVLHCKNNMTLLGYLVNFNLSVGEPVLVSDADGKPLASLTIPSMAERESYGLCPQTGLYQFYGTPTKGEENP